MTTVHTVGHGTLSSDEFATLIEGAHVDYVADVRSFPGSRRNPQFGRDEMEQWIPKAGIGYAWMRELGGRRKPVAVSKHTALRNDAFRAYADHMDTPSFFAGIEGLLVLAESNSPTVMCSESLWWRCHRRLISDFLVLVRGIDVVHLMHDGRSTPHALTEGVRVAEEALIYDVGITPPLAII